jgi:hypothetical protein
MSRIFRIHRLRPRPTREAPTASDAYSAEGTPSAPKCIVLPAQRAIRSRPSPGCVRLVARRMLDSLVSPTELVTPRCRG